MLYLGIDLYRKQMTVCLRDEEGEILLRCQVTTRWKKTSEFFAQLGENARKQAGGFVVIREICGFHHWLAELLAEQGRWSTNGRLGLGKKKSEIGVPTSVQQPASRARCRR